MSTSVAIPSTKVAIYFDLVSGRSARETAARFNLTHPTAIKYANDALEVLRTLPAVVTNPQLSAYMSDSVKKQVFGFTPDIRESLLEVLQPYLDEAAVAVAAPTEPSLTISFRLPESVFYQFDRLVAVHREQRGTDVTISSLGAEIISAFVKTGAPPVSEAKFKQADMIMDEIRQILAKYGITDS